MTRSKKPFLLEVSWEVCNKVGGIHTVLKSKAAEAQKAFGDHYYLVGPLFDHNPEFIEQQGGDFTTISQKLQKAGIKAKCGIWNTPEKPRVILVRFKDSLDQSRLLYTLWKDFGVDSMTGGADYQEPVLFATMAAKVIETVASLNQEAQFTAHFHDWTTGAGILHLKKHAPRIATVYTAHSTVVGHAVCSNGINLYNSLDQINSDREAEKWSVVAKHSLESASARECDIFTTVSKITAEEAKSLLNAEASQILINGLNAKQIPSYKENASRYSENRNKLLSFASAFLKRDLKSDNTAIISISGRYEFINKGIDLYLESLAHLKNEDGIEKNVVAFIFALANARQPNDSFRSEQYSAISTHPLWEPANDLVIANASRLGINNSQDSKVNLILVPAYLNGSDGVLNMEYFDALTACDLTIYPSWYESWGYTPLESIAYSVPTVCSDVSGFGQWIQATAAESDGIKVLSRRNATFTESVESLANHIRKIIHLDSVSLNKLRVSVRQTALTAEWENFYRNYMSTYEMASNKLQERHKTDSDASTAKESTAFRGTNSPRPRFKQFSVITSLPKQLERLRELAHNIWWVWNADATELFIRLDPVLFEKIGNNPVALLELVEPSKLDAISKNESYMLLYESVMKKFDKYMSLSGSLLKDLEGVTPDRPVAYFSMEFGLHECLPLYSGGLGILSGDHMKSASDINLPLFGVGLLYKNGYFKQGISKDGVQKVEYFHNDFFRMPLREITRNGERLTIGIDFPGRMIYARIWEAKVGRVSIYFLDTDIQENSGSDREITAKLYGGDKRTRIEQEIVLGIGGVRLVEELNLTPSVYHLNEGHSAVLIVERFINLMKFFNVDFKTAGEIIKGSTVFTTHTPVPAGNETFDMSLVENYLRTYVESSGLAWQDFCD
ncbi:MAG: alpha-glucan family phosphorylase, partial [Fibrobacteres bacterium]|nr:alpha-glucan family phosphorylase [Fibrobacterota bacterium]